jgi:sterol desaturase/sphingolipid hydroxylase (fatty acid hydroxylase superfamily)
MLLYLLPLIITSFIISSVIYLTIHHKNYEKRTIDTNYIQVVFINFIIMLLYSYSIFIGHKYLFNTERILNISVIITTFLIIDALYYWIHRIIHRTPFLKNLIHIQHHDINHLLPSDTFFETPIDFLILILLHYPSIFVQCTGVEYIILVTLSFYHNIYIHTESKKNPILPWFIPAEFHTHHHTIGKGNYSSFFPFWDDYMETRIPVPKKKTRRTTRKRGIRKNI